MKLHYLQHVPFEGLGAIGDWADSQRVITSVTRLYEEERPPAVDDLDLLVILGGPMSVHDEQQYSWLATEKDFLRDALQAGKPTLGICLGAQLLAEVLGGRVHRCKNREIGWHTIERTPEAPPSPILSWLATELEVFHWHGETFSIPPGAARFAESDACLNQGFLYGNNVVGLQFHLETTPPGAKALAEHCAEDLVPGPFVQIPTTWLGPNDRFTRANACMCRLLDAWVQV
jgi:GMP synthase-like glutamine amidotransferase